MSRPEASSDWVVESPILGRWRIQDQFVGGMGIVYKVWDEALNSPMAIKIPAAGVDRDRFEREARLMLETDPHPNVALLVEVERLRSRPLIVMIYYPDGDLSRWIGTPRLLVDIPLVLRLALQVCDGMMHVQACGIGVHCDLKPRNVLMLRREVIAISDFGLALAYDESRDRVGTPEYMAPEVVTRGEISEWSDIYSLGAMLYEMLSGAPPFGSRPRVAHHELWRRHVEAAPQPIAGVPNAVWRIVKDCLAKKRERRPQSFSDLREQLGHAYVELVGMEPPAPLTALDVNAWTWTMRGQGLCNLGRHEDEEACYRQAIELDRTQAVAHSYLANNLRELNRLEEALDSADQALALDPGLQHAHDVRGSILDELGEIAGAEEQLRAAVAINPTYAMAWYNLGVLLDNQRRLDEAMSCYEEAVRLEPHLAQAWANMGVILADRKEWQRAEEYYQKALLHEPCLQETIFNYGLLLRNQGRHEAALQLYDEVEKECG